MASSSSRRVEKVVRFLNRVGFRKPLIQAPMAGATTPAMVAAVCNSGALGSLAAAYTDPEELRAQINEVRSLTHSPFNVNLFAPTPAAAAADAADEAAESRRASAVERAKVLLARPRTELGLPEVEGDLAPMPSFERQVEVLLEEDVPIFSFTFGHPDEAIMRAMRERAVTVIGTATTVDEAVRLEEIGCDAIVAQGFEAGGHRGSFLEDSPFASSQVGTMALVPAVVDAVRVPVIAAGGIMDGRSLVAAFALGAVCAQMGTAFLAVEESTLSAAHRELLNQATERDSVQTSAFTGRLARGLRNRFVDDMAKYQHELPEFPLQHRLTQPIQREAARQANHDFMALWSGQGVRQIQPGDVHHGTAEGLISSFGKESLGVMAEIQEVYEAVLRLRKPGRPKHAHPRKFE